MAGRDFSVPAVVCRNRLENSWCYDACADDKSKWRLTCHGAGYENSFWPRAPIPNHFSYPKSWIQGPKRSGSGVDISGGRLAGRLDATAAYVAEQSIVNDVTFSQVEIYFPNPWGDMPPTHAKMIAKAYYSGPDPAKSPWPDEPWAIFAADRAPTMPDVEWYELSNALIEKLGEKISDPNKLSEEADEQARRMIIKKYGLTNKWQVNDSLGLSGTSMSRNQISIAGKNDADISVSALHKCLEQNESGSLFQDCTRNRVQYVFDPSMWPPEDPKEYITKVDFTVSWAKRLKGFKTLDDLQSAAGTKGTISERKLNDRLPSVSYHWRSEPTNGRVGYMLATLYQDRGIGVSILTDENIEIVLNNFGAFICDRCSPPIDIEGETPSWAK